MMKNRNWFEWVQMEIDEELVTARGKEKLEWTCKSTKIAP
jgi:hypothetical protein